jgi:pterin-4a-carbinolamine dehydratase
MGQTIPPADALPDGLAGLGNRQAVQVRRDFWDNDIRLLIVQLHEMRPGATSTERSEPYPMMTSLRPVAIPDSRVRAALKTQLTGWQYVKSPLPENPKAFRMELFREYRFPSFQAVIRFMREVSVGCDIADHHPRSEISTTCSASI